MRLQDLVHPRAIVANLQSSDRAGVIRELVQVLADAGQISADSVDAIARSILARERSRGTTGFGKGVAAPHAKLDGLSRPMAAVGRSVSGIDFSSLDGEPVFGLFLILSPSESAALHLRIMNVVFGHLQQERFRKFLRQADLPEKIYDLLCEADEQVTVS